MGLGTEAIPVCGKLNPYLPYPSPSCFQPHVEVTAPTMPPPLLCPEHSTGAAVQAWAASATQLHYLLYFGKQCELKPSLEGCALNQEGMNNFHQTPLYFMSRFCHLFWTKIHLMNTTLRHGVSLLTRHCSLPDFAAVAGDTVSAQSFGTGCHTSCGGVHYKIMVKQTSASVM